MNAVSTIVESLSQVFAPMDAEVLAASQVWAKGRVAALREFKASDEYTALRKNQWALYEKLHALAGGKTWFNVFEGRNAAMIEDCMVKNCAAAADARNARIAKKLVASEVTEVVSTEYTQTRDGFNGTFVVTTNKGKKVVQIETIRAGGYNIVCLHLRVLVKVK